MTYLRYNPSPPLNSYIHCLYYRDRPMPYAREKILPVPWIDLMINFGGPFRAYEADQTRPFANCDHSRFVGLRSAYHLVDWPPDMRFFIVEFKPGGAYPFLRLPLSELQHQVVTLEAIWGQYAAEIRERLLLARLCEAPHGFRTVQYAISQIARQGGALSIRELSDQMGISHKHLIAQFKRLVGATPKELARTCRFQHSSTVWT
jgi:AraC-like DNA-binding protein